MNCLWTSALQSVVGIALSSSAQAADVDAPMRFFKGNQVGMSADYGVFKKTSADDHVISVHGFMDDRAECQKIADALNVDACKELGGTACLDPYECRSLNDYIPSA